MSPARDDATAPAAGGRAGAGVSDGCLAVHFPFGAAPRPRPIRVEIAFQGVQNPSTSAQASTRQRRMSFSDRPCYAGTWAPFPYELLEP